MYEHTITDSTPAAGRTAAQKRASLSGAALSPEVVSPEALSPEVVSPEALSPAKKKPLRRGFAVLDAERRREIARLGGQTAHKNGNAHRFNPEEASEAGKKGGATVSENRNYMADIGRRGGLAKRGYKLRRAELQPVTEQN